MIGNVLKKLVLPFLTYLILAAGACESNMNANTNPEPLVQGNNTMDPDQCRANGGVPTAGLIGPVCAVPNADAGASCNTNDDCTGFCLAESRTCSPHNPYFGCHDVLIAPDQAATLCVD